MASENKYLMRCIAAWCRDSLFNCIERSTSNALSFKTMTAFVYLPGTVKEFGQTSVVFNDEYIQCYYLKLSFEVEEADENQLTYCRKMRECADKLGIEDAFIYEHNTKLIRVHVELVQRTTNNGVVTPIVDEDHSLTFKNFEFNQSRLNTEINFYVQCWLNHLEDSGQLVPGIESDSNSNNEDEDYEF